MLRQLARRAKEELRRFFDDVDAADAAEAQAAEPVVVPAAKPASRWESPGYHIEVLGSRVCPDCDEPKVTGRYRCAPCHEKAIVKENR